MCDKIAGPKRKEKLKFEFLSDVNFLNRPTSIVIGSGKGGVGKTLMAANIAYQLALQNKKVILVDCDLRSPSLHTLFNIHQPKKSLADIIYNSDIKINNLCHETALRNLKLICCPTHMLGMSDYAEIIISKIVSSCSQLKTEFIIYDLGTGLNFFDSKLFLNSDIGILVGTPDPVSISKNFDFLKLCILQKLESTCQDNQAIVSLIKDAYTNFDPKINSQIKSVVNKLQNQKYVHSNILPFKFNPGFILNMVHGKSDILFALKLEISLKQTFGVSLKQWGKISYFSQIRNIIKEKSFANLLMNSDWIKEPYQDILNKLIHYHKNLQYSNKKFADQGFNPRKGKFEAVSDSFICSANCSLWDNCDHQRGGFPCRIKYIGFINTN